MIRFFKIKTSHAQHMVVFQACIHGNRLAHEIANLICYPLLVFHHFHLDKKEPGSSCLELVQVLSWMTLTEIPL